MVGPVGAALTHEEAEEVEADEQHPLAASLPRVVVERRAAAVLTLGDDRLVVLVALHGAGYGEPPGALRAAAAVEPVCVLGTRRRGVQPGRRVPTADRVVSPVGASAFLSAPNCSLVQGEESQIPSGNFCRAVLPGTRPAGVRLRAGVREWAAVGVPPRSFAAT